jgi:hypothetical protein
MWQISLLATSLLFSYGMSHAQFEGKFTYYEEFITFRNGIAQFEVLSNGGLVVQLRGTGSYEIVGNYLLINTVTDKSLRQSSYDSIRSINSSKITFVDEEGNPISGVNVTWLDQSGKTYGKASTQNGTIASSQLKSQIIHASFIGYDDITIKLIDGFDYLVTMAEGQTLENQTVVFKLISCSDDAIELKLLTENFIVRQNKAKGLAKLERGSEELRLRRLVK